MVRRFFGDGRSLPEGALEQARGECRIESVLVLPPAAGEEQDPYARKPLSAGDASLVLEQWDPQSQAGCIERHRLVLRKLEGEWKIVSWEDVSLPCGQPDDIMICMEQRWWGLPELASPVNVVCNFALETTYHPEWLPRFMAPGVEAPKNLHWDEAEVAAVRLAVLAGNASAAGTLPEEAEVDLDVDVYVPSEGMADSRYRFTVRRLGDEWRIARIEYLGRRPDPTGEGK